VSPLPRLDLSHQRLTLLSNSHNAESCTCCIDNVACHHGGREHLDSTRPAGRRGACAQVCGHRGRHEATAVPPTGSVFETGLTERPLAFPQGFNPTADDLRWQTTHFELLHAHHYSTRSVSRTARDGVLGSTDGQNGQRPSPAAFLSLAAVAYVMMKDRPEWYDVVTKSNVDCRPALVGFCGGPSLCWYWVKHKFRARRQQSAISRKSVYRRYQFVNWKRRSVSHDSVVGKTWWIDGVLQKHSRWAARIASRRKATTLPRPMPSLLARTQSLSKKLLPGGSSSPMRCDLTHGKDTKTQAVVATPRTESNSRGAKRSTTRAPAPLPQPLAVLPRRLMALMSLQNCFPQGS
jgi:hypothetical protein